MCEINTLLDGTFGFMLFMGMIFALVGWCANCITR